MARIRNPPTETFLGRPGIVIEYGSGFPKEERVVPTATRPGYPGTNVYIDGILYAVFASNADAKEAVGMWQGWLDGLGRRVTEHFGPHWPAIGRRHVEIC